MDKKYQVFVSSTYQDLTEERREVIQALLELDCIPIGMEMFPAANDDQWTLIKNLIDDCDYYILIIGGRYGTISSTGISYTEMEYKYALEKGIPDISFLHKDPDQLPVSRTDKDEQKRKKLSDFKDLVSKKSVRYWETPSDLGSVVSRSLIKLIRTNPRTGWVKADNMSTDKANLEILQLRERINELETKYNDNIDISDLSQGEDKTEIDFVYTIPGNTKKRETISITWNELFIKTCTLLIDEAAENDYFIHVNNYLKHVTKKNHYDLMIVADFFRQILIQFKALGLVEKSIKKRLLKDNQTYWKLTPKGDQLLTQLRAIKRKE